MGVCFDGVACCCVGKWPVIAWKDILLLGLPWGPQFEDGRWLFSSASSNGSAGPMLERRVRLFVHGRKHPFTQTSIMDETFDLKYGVASSTIWYDYMNLPQLVQGLGNRYGNKRNVASINIDDSVLRWESCFNGWRNCSPTWWPHWRHIGPLHCSRSES